MSHKAVLSACLLILAVILGLDTSLAGIDLGIKAGVGFTTWHDLDAIVDPEYKTGLHAGGFAAFPVSDVFAVQIEALYTQEGWESTQIATDAQGNEIGEFVFKWSFTYLEFPILAKFYLPGHRLHLLAGPALSFKLSSKLKSPDDPVLQSDPVERDLDGYKSTDFTAVIGAGLDIPIGERKIILDVRCNLGLTDIQDDPRVAASAKNLGFVFMAGFGF